MLEQQYPALWHFCGAYLHQDWRDEYDSTTEALRDFVDGSPNLASRLPREVDQALDTTPDEVTADDLLANLGCSFVPSRAGLDPRDWLRQMKAEAQLLLDRRG